MSTDQASVKFQSVDNFQEQLDDDQCLLEPVLVTTTISTSGSAGFADIHLQRGEGRSARFLLTQNQLGDLVQHLRAVLVSLEDYTGTTED